MQAYLGTCKHILEAYRSIRNTPPIAFFTFPRVRVCANLNEFRFSAATRHCLNLHTEQMLRFFS